MRIEIAQRKKAVFELVLPIRWGDMDAMGHLNNASYFRYMESCRIDWLHASGFMLDKTGEGPIIVNAFCNFYRQLEYPGDVALTMYVSDPARTTFETWFTFERTDARGVVYAAGGATTIWVDFPAQKAVALPQRVREIVS